MAAGAANRLSKILGGVRSLSAVRRVGGAIRGLGFLTGGVRRNRASTVEGPWSALVFGVPPQLRNHVDLAFPELRKYFVARKADPKAVRAEFDRLGHNAVICWGSSPPPSMTALAREVDQLTIAHIYEGPFRVDGDAGKLLPFVLDWTGLYVNTRRSCDFEYFGDAFPFDKNPKLVLACAGMREKYVPVFARPDDWQDYIAVIVQDRTDPSFAFVETGQMTPAELTRFAASEHPDLPLKIIVTATGEQGETVEAALRQELGAAFEDRIEFIAEDERFHVLVAAKAVCTVNSALASAALLAKRPVTVFAPCFYAGWGLSDDRFTVTRRRRKLSLDEFSTLVFGLYFRWLSPEGAFVFPDAPTDEP